ncbi:MAG: glycosyltransferase [Brevibacterium sp.]|uniref:D-inositol 3-phosphate glycosyltransferase n=1 Tax=Brevibacterium aurantiacum TaxID=273384 RepID=A0A2H1IT89_BREAU|nr:glycosyltransferase [Brevibacterium aurantiacum]AZL10754.1 glycosyl transferase family 1 [Brevibacterium aurantiacum]GEB21635.1 glycosyl transferase [Brevibacterium aurantiacum]SMX78427.1 Glycosyltransferase involved in cell wall bisynthesis [Brevibacterium aurantiacum]
MKILHITDAAAGGVLSSISALARSQAADPRYEKVALRYTPRSDSPGHEAIAEIMGPGVELERWSATPRFAVAGLARGLLAELRRDWDVIHLHSSRAGFLARVFATVLPTRALLVYSPHGFAFNQIEFSPRAARMFLTMERLALRGGRDLVLVSGSEAAVAKQKLPGSRTAVLPNAVDDVAFAPADRQPSSHDGPLEVVHVGRILTQKRPEHFARIAAKAAQEHPGRFSFTWIGDGDRSLLADCQDITITGWLTSDGIRRHLSRASILLFTSAAEGMPISLLEAASMGVPTVGADVIGVRDLIDHGVDGMLFDTVDEGVAALSELTDDERRGRLAAAARARVERDHSQADLADRSLRIYCDFIAPEPAVRQTSAADSPHLNGENPTETLAVTDTGRRSV